MAPLDRRGLPISTRSDLAAERYREGVDLLLSAWPGAAETLDEAIVADPEFALAHAARARLQAFSGSPNHYQARVDLCERYATNFEPDGWWFLTYWGWSHAEKGAVRLG